MDKYPNRNKVGDKMKSSTGKPQYGPPTNKPSKENIKNHLKILFIKSLIVLVIILIALLFSSINTPTARSITEEVKSKLSYEYKVLEDSKKVYNWAKEKMKLTIESIPAIKHTPTYMAPVQGKVYRSFNQDIQVDGAIKKNGGLDIIVENSSNPISIINGVVEKVEEKDRQGHFVTVSNEDMTVVYGYLKTPFVKEGESIMQGAEIGTIGTNKDDKKYLRFEIYIDQKAVDPLNFIDL